LEDHTITIPVKKGGKEPTRLNYYRQPGLRTNVEKEGRKGKRETVNQVTYRLKKNAETQLPCSRQKSDGKNPAGDHRKEARDPEPAGEKMETRKTEKAYNDEEGHPLTCQPSAESEETKGQGGKEQI